MNSLISQLPPQSVWIGLGLLVTAAVAAILARVRRVPASEVLGLFGLSVLAGALMSRVFWLVLDPSVELAVAWARPAVVFDPRLGGHSSFGALAGGAAVMAVWLWQQRAEWAASAVDVLVPSGLAGLALARIGCLANGCDFGRRADIDWAIRHPAGSEAFAAHLQRGWVAADAAWSAPVYPFALLLAAGTLVIVAVGAAAVAYRRFQPGRIAFGASGAYFLWRFTIEWTRDPATVLGWSRGLNVHHVLAIVGLCLVVGAFFFRDACGRSPLA